MDIASIGIDLGKTTFHLIALNEHGKIVIRKKFSRKQLLAYTANLQQSLIGMEVCAGAHFIGAALRDQGHDVRIIPAQFVKPFVKSNKNDFKDAEAIAEAVTRKNVRFVPIQDRRPARPPGLAPRSRSTGASPHSADQPDPRFSSGAWDHVRQGGS